MGQLPPEGAFDWWLIAVTAATGLGFSAMACMARGGLPYAALFAFLVSMTGLDFGRLTIADVVAVPGLALGLLGAVRSRRVIAPQWLLGIPLVVLAYGAGVVVLTDASATDLPVYAGSLLLAPLLLCLHGTTESRLRLLMAAFALGAAVNAIVAIYDAMTPGVLVEALGTQSGELRPAGLTTHSNQLGLVCAMAAPMTLHLADRSRRSLWFTVFLILAGGSLASGSRAGVAGFAFAALAYVVLDRNVGIKRVLQLTLLGAVGVFVAVSAGLTFAIDRLLGLTDSAAEGARLSDRGRAALSDQAWHDLINHLWTGIGYGGASAHNYYLSVARGGGMLVLLMVVIWSLYALRRGWLVRDRVDSMAASLAAATLWFVFANRYNAFNERFLWFPLGLVAAGCLLARSAQRPENRPDLGLADGGSPNGRILGDMDVDRSVPRRQSGSVRSLGATTTTRSPEPRH
ncbi:hypothetical protein NGTWS0302_02400 [Mycolicibacterium cyprinidarum]|uniref:O-antigen ligase domain-containing protein n=1 Tax=Mycolicibacterium cyprinidarum TaxID=2860311 RepID=A0ABQ4V5G4_9MYCO|nr:hypothetical protein NGTWS1702_00030 [Mycolicibacterium sp. NGTWSNA01]GJF12675.1 hypothetical protein NGTWS0302_02400 [Mycolicibacterium sp. NGTWS0302]